MSRSSYLALALAAMSFATSTAHAQFSGGPPSPERLFGFMDRDRNGVLDRKEVEGAFGPMRDVLMKQFNVDRGISQKEFEQAAPKLMEDMQRRRDEDRGRDDRDRDRDRERERERDRERERERERERAAEQQRASQQSSSSSSSSSRSSSSSSKKPVPKKKVTVELPRAFQALDINNDGQIGLYEWDRAKFADFQAADHNGDGLLTAKEILAAKVSPAAPKTTGTSNTSTASTSGTSSSSKSGATSPTSGSTSSTSSSGKSSSPVAVATAAPSSGKAVEPMKVDGDSSDGRMAKYIFGRLDLDKDGSLTEAEWSKSQSVRQSFEKFGAKMPLPIKADDFAGWQVAVQKAERSK